MILQVLNIIGIISVLMFVGVLGLGNFFIFKDSLKNKKSEEEVND